MHLFHGQELSQPQASPDQLSAVSFVRIPLWRPGQFLARVQAVQWV